MENYFSNFKKIRELSKTTVVLSIVSVVLLVVTGYVAFLYSQEKNQGLALQKQIGDLQEGLKNASDSISNLETQKTNLTTALTREQQRTSSYSNQLDTVTNTVEELQRRAAIDPEVLQKYSKVYFLNENYVPSLLSNIDTKYLYTKNKPLQIHDRVLPFLQSMLNAAANDGVTIQVISAYRSFGTQATLKSSYKVIYGAGTANQFSADQGYSEHQLGTTLDFTTPVVGATFSGFQKTDAGKWLDANAYKYGFILSYPADNTYYEYEPWHWRFVGLDLALRLHNEGKHFYDLDQRDINQYLTHFFNGTTTAAVN